ncbi:PREDICTED: microtubule-associated protein futsch-like [Nicotiana attenuata]|uniref:microtubule-associated protein futsch-like n=1 Tax=Nicotiana attenuata TaxID=49451 RepID=UPI0009053C3A|nr:PREDICTED: microtubule-associated protein futsch-like [Nicotiana attenuata]
MLARKTVATGALSKKLNAKLKASQAQDSENSDDSFKSAREGEGTGSSDSEQATSVQNPPSEESEGVSSDVRKKGKKVADSSPTSEMVRMAIYGAEHEKVVESSKKTGGSDSGEEAEELKRRTPTPKAPSTGKTTKKRKATSPTTADIPLPKGRATRSKLKRSKDELQKAMEESKKKRMDKGKAKVAEPVEAVDVDEMDPPKKIKTSSKKSSSVSKTAEPPLAKRTRSAVKAKQVKITEEEDWSGEEESESDNEQDKLAKFGKRTILKGRLLKDLEEPGMVRLVDALAVLGWKDMVKGVQVSVDAKRLEILDIPSEWYDDYTRQRWPSLDSLPTTLAITRKFCDSTEVNEAKSECVADY